MRRTINGDNRQMLNHAAALIIASLFSFALYSNAMAEEPREGDSAKFQEIAQGMMGSGRGGRHGMMMRRPNDPASLKTSWPENKQMFDALTLGGQGYDNWAKLQGKKLPTTTHPACPANGKRKGATTWRCKECHGWDYEGVKGAYAKGSHFSGVRGITAAQGGGVNPLGGYCGGISTVTPKKLFLMNCLMILSNSSAIVRWTPGNSSITRLDARIVWSALRNRCAFDANAAI